MIRPSPSYYECPKCKYQEKHHPKSDALDIKDILRVCPKCDIPMIVIKKKDFKTFHKIMNIFK